jgi:hypothetical protein
MNERASFMRNRSYFAHRLNCTDFVICPLNANQKRIVVDKPIRCL